MTINENSEETIIYKFTPKKSKGGGNEKILNAAMKLKKRTCSKCNIEKAFLLKSRDHKGTRIFIDEEGSIWQGTRCNKCHLKYAKESSNRRVRELRQYYDSLLKQKGIHHEPIKKTKEERQRESSKALHQSSFGDRMHSDNKTYELFPGKCNEIYLASSPKKRSRGFKEGDILSR